nr:capsid protein [Macrobrachium rosenbergii nodavirus]AFN53608.1 capsid protein [Macrobrachium rosenbergii nodavirus]
MARGKQNSNQTQNNSNANGKRRKRNRRNRNPQTVPNFNPIVAKPTVAPLQTNIRSARSDVNAITVLNGSDFLTTVKVRGSNNLTDSKSRILVKQPISASSFLGTRISGLSQFWERYRWHKAAVRYVPAVPNTLACQLIGYIDTDPLDDPNVILDVDQLLRQATSQVGARQWNFSDTTTIPLIVRRDDQLYYTGQDKENVRFSQQGVFYLLQVTTLLNISGEAITNDLISGSLYLDWVCGFSMPQINPTPVEISQLTYDADTIGNWVPPTELKQTYTQDITGLKPNSKFIIVPYMDRVSSEVLQKCTITCNEVDAVGSISYFDTSPIKCDGYISFQANSIGEATFTLVTDYQGAVDPKPYQYRIIRAIVGNN